MKKKQVITTSNRSNLCDEILSSVMHLQNLVLPQVWITQLLKKPSSALCFPGAVLCLSICSFGVLLLCSHFISTSHTRTASKI